MKFGLAGFVVASLVACSDSQPKLWSVAAADASAERQLVEGPVLGGLGRHDSLAWLGIPFAAPPVGDLRFRPPQPVAAWTKPREALTFGAPCPQYASPIGGVDAKPGTIVGNEDCLYLNVWTPKFAKDSVPSGTGRLPVMFWIHGGGNTVGTSAIYDASHLASEQQVVVVSVDYRLGPFGFFHHRAFSGEDASDHSGNFAILDLIAALKWVRENASAFGGDPDNVTIFGESAGAADVYALLLAPKAKGLFRHAMAESPVFSEAGFDEAENFADDPSPGHTQSSNEIVARLLIKEGRATDRAQAKQKLSAMSPGEVATFLRALPADRVLETYTSVPVIGLIQMPQPFADGELLPKAPWSARFAEPNGWNQVPVLIGTNHDEVRLFLFFDPARVTQVFSLLPRFVDEPSYLATSEWGSRGWKAHNADDVARAMRKSGAKDVYVYRFDWHDEPTIVGADLGVMLGAAHGLEIPFVFGDFDDLGKLAALLYDGDDRRRYAEQLSSAVRAYVGEFARKGNPKFGGPATLPWWTAWDESKPQAPKFLELDIPSAGGIRMSSAAEDLPTILAGIETDARLTTQAQRCGTYEVLAGWMHIITPAQYLTSGRLGCKDYPLAHHRWDKPLPNP